MLFSVTAVQPSTSYLLGWVVGPPQVSAVGLLSASRKVRMASVFAHVVMAACAVTCAAETLDFTALPTRLVVTQFGAVSGAIVVGGLW